ELIPSNGIWTEKILHSFTCCEDSNPMGGLIFDASGDLYGTNFGYNTTGTVFELAPSNAGWTETILDNFSSGGSNPASRLVFDRAGNLYGSTFFGGNGGG